MILPWRLRLTGENQEPVAIAADDDPWQHIQATRPSSHPERHSHSLAGINRRGVSSHSQEAAALLERPLVDGRRDQPIAFIHLSALAIDRERIGIGNEADVLLGDALLSHDLGGLGHRQRIAG